MNHHELMRPDFLILGAQKCGTTSLAYALRFHPDVFIPAVKEAHHFGRVPDAEAGGAAYHRFFADWAGQRLRGEATPAYLYNPLACPQIVRVAPDVRAVVVLRNPVERAYSAYWHGVRVDALRTSFEQALDDEPRALAEGDWGWASLVDRGRYVVQLERYVQAGLDRSQLLVLVYEELVSDPQAGLRAVQEHLGISPLITELPRLNPAARSVLPPWARAALTSLRAHSTLSQRLLQSSMREFRPPPMLPATRQALLDRFRADNRDLEEWLGRDLAPWRS